jgi:hypothetical protein
METPSWLDGSLHHFRRTLPAAKLSMLGHVAVGAQSHQVREGVVALLAPLDPVMHLQVFQGLAVLTLPTVSLQHQLDHMPVNLLPQLDPLRFPQHLRAASSSASSPWFVRRAGSQAAKGPRASESPAGSPPTLTPPSSPPENPHRSVRDNAPRALCPHHPRSHVQRPFHHGQLALGQSYVHPVCDCSVSAPNSLPGRARSSRPSPAARAIRRRRRGNLGGAQHQRSLEEQALSGPCISFATGRIQGLCPRGGTFLPAIAANPAVVLLSSL